MSDSIRVSATYKVTRRKESLLRIATLLIRFCEQSFSSESTFLLIYNMCTRHAHA